MSLDQRESMWESLFGRHMLQGVERTAYTKKDFIFGDNNIEECEAVKFTLDGVSYLVYCDPSDGYRSYCSEIIICEEKARFTIPDTDVLCTQTNRDYEDVMQVLNANTGKTIFEIGTRYTDEYYPTYIFDYYPENI